MRIKKLISIVLSAVMILTATVALCACSPKEFKLYHIKDAYDENIITSEDVLKIGEYYSAIFKNSVSIQNYNDNGATENDPIDIDDDIILPTINKELELEIKDAYFQERRSLETYIENGWGKDKEDLLDRCVHLTYLGAYGSKQAVLIKADMWTAQEGENTIVLGNVVFALRQNGIIFIYA